MGSVWRARPRRCPAPVANTRLLALGLAHSSLDQHLIYVVFRDCCFLCVCLHYPTLIPLIEKHPRPGAPQRQRRGDADGRGRSGRPLLLQPPREGGLLRRLGARSPCYCCLDPIPPTEGGERKYAHGPNSRFLNGRATYTPFSPKYAIFAPNTHRVRTKIRIN